MFSMLSPQAAALALHDIEMDHLCMQCIPYVSGEQKPCTQPYTAAPQPLAAAKAIVALHMLRSHQHVRTMLPDFALQGDSPTAHLNTWGLAGKYLRNMGYVGAAINRAGSTGQALEAATCALEQPEGPVPAGQLHFWRQRLNAH